MKVFSDTTSPLKILIVEDEAIIALDIKNILRRLGYSIFEMASSGEESIQKADHIQPDLVLMDIRLKGEIDGVKAAEKIYERFHMPVVYISADGEDKEEQLTKASAFIKKPFEEEEIKTVLRRLFAQNFN